MGRETFTFHFVHFSLYFPAKSSLILVQFFNVNRGCLSDEIMGHFLPWFLYFSVLKKAPADTHHLKSKIKAQDLIGLAYHLKPPRIEQMNIYLVLFLLKLITELFRN